MALVLEFMKSDELRTGIWLNVIGYVLKSGPRRSREQRLEGTAEQAEGSSVQALIAWSAGALLVGEYERILLLQQEGRKQVEQALLAE